MSCESPCSLCSPGWYEQAGAPTVKPLAAHSQAHVAFKSSGAGYRGGKTLRLCPGCAARALSDLAVWTVSVETPPRIKRQIGPTMPLALQYSDALV